MPADHYSSALYGGDYRSNFLGTSFTVYDSGVNPSRHRSRLRHSAIREEMALTRYVCLYMYMYMYMYMLMMPGIGRHASFALDDFHF